MRGIPQARALGSRAVAPALLALLLLVLVAAAGCAAMFPAPVPMRAVAAESARPAAAGEPVSRCLLVLLPGRGDRAEDFVERGFVEAVRKRSLAVDVVAADATFGYYARRTLLDRLRDDVIEPARARGYEQVWIAGISMGGLGSLLYAQQQPGLAGVVLFAPFLGDEEVLEEIEKAGGPGAWKPGEIARDDYQRDLWRWLQGALANDEPPVYLAFGASDRMARGHRLLASALPEGRVFTAEGGHDWATWAQLWDAFLDRSDFAQRCRGDR